MSLDNTNVSEGELMAVMHFLYGTKPPVLFPASGVITYRKLQEDDKLLAELLSNAFWQERCKLGLASQEADGMNNVPLSLDEFQTIKEERIDMKSRLEKFFDDKDGLKGQARAEVNKINNITTQWKEMEKKSSAKNKLPEDWNMDEKWGDFAQSNDDYRAKLEE